MCYGLKRRKNMHPRPFASVYGSPVDQGRGALHHKKGSFLQASHQTVSGSRVNSGVIFVLPAVPVRIAVPGNDIQLFCPFKIIQRFIKTHHIGCYGQLTVFSDRPDFFFAEIQKLVADKPFPVQFQTVQYILPHRRSAAYLRPVRIGMAPEGSPPGGIQGVQCLVSVLEPGVESLLAPGTMTGSGSPISPVFIGNMPGDHSGVISKLPGQHPVHSSHLLTHDRGAGTEVMPVSRKTPQTIFLRLQHFFIFLRHPGRHGPRRCCQNRKNLIFIQTADDLFQPLSFINPFFRL